MNVLKRRIIWYVIRDAFLIALFVLFLFVLYLTHHGFPDVLLRFLERKAQVNGFVVSFDSAKLNVFEGVIVNRVRYYRMGSVGCPLLEIEKTVLTLNPIRKFNKESGILQMVIRNGVVCLPVSHEMKRSVSSGVPRVMRVENINARLALGHNAKLIRINDLSADFLEMSIGGRGILIMPEVKKRIDLVSSDTPVTRLVPDGRHQKALNGAFMAELVRYGDVLLEKNTAIVDLDFRVDLGDLSNLDMVVAIDSREKEAISAASPAGTFSGYIRFEGGKGEGSFNMKNRFLYDVWVENAKGRLGIDDNKITLYQLNALIGEEPWRGPLNLSMAYYWNTREYHGEVTTGFDPNAVLIPLEKNRSHSANVIKDFRFDTDPPVCIADFKGSLGEKWSLEMNGMLHAWNYRYKGVTNKMLNAEFSVELSETDRFMKLAPISVEFDDAMVDANLRLDFLAETVEFNGVSRTDPRNVAQMIGPFMQRLIGMFFFDGPADVVASGTAGFRDTSKNDFNVFLDGRRFGWHRFMCDEGVVHVSGVGERVDISEISGSAYGGTFSGGLSFLPIQNSTNLRYTLEAQVNDLDFDMFMRAIMGEKKSAYHGVCSVSALLEGYTGEDQWERLSGKGKIRISDGRIFQIPLFGPLSNMMTKLLPGLGLLLRQTDARADVVVDNGEFFSERILVEGGVFSMMGQGSCAIDGTLDFNVRFVLLRQHTLAGIMMRTITMPVSKILEFRLSGTLNDPRWRPTYLPKELFLILGTGE